MASIWQCGYEWTGFQGAPGFTNLYFAADTEDPAEALDAVEKGFLLFDFLADWGPSTVTVTPQTDVRLLSDITGDLLDIVTVTGLTPKVGAVNARYSAVSGACIIWPTTTIHGTRRMQGRTFLVPLTQAAYQSDGTLDPSAVSTIAADAEAMRTASGPVFGVWGRPRAASAGPPPVTARDGIWGPATSSRVPDRVAELRSRRD